MEPWTGIELPDTHNAYKARLANPEHPLDFYWGRNINGQYIFRFMGRFPPEICDDAPAMRGIEVLAGTEGDRSHLTLVLESQEDGKIFLFLCNSLMEATGKTVAGNDSAAVRIILTHLTRWQSLLHNRGSKYLSLEQQAGLFGELLVLKDIYLANLSPREAVESWTGPMGDEQDFGYGSSLVEVKTTRSTRDQVIKIASVNQLDSISGSISLVFQTVGVFEDQPPKSISLNALVSAINEELEACSAEVTDQFGMRLAMVGYESHPEYDKHNFAPVNRRIFAVEEGFPRICASDLREGVVKTSYSIMVDACLSHEIEAELALERILQGVSDTKLETIDVPAELLVKLDESAMLEFKSTLRVCLKTGQPEKYIEHAILKTIAALANTRGGRLVIGVSDDNTILGLQTDYESLKRNDRDGFEQAVSTMLMNNFGEIFAAKFVRLIFHEIYGRDICIVDVQRSSELQFLEQSDRSGQKTKKLFVRIGNSSREIPPEKIPAYLDDRS